MIFSQGGGSEEEVSRLGHLNLWTLLQETLPMGLCKTSGTECENW
jgi:hypothetical protein